MLGSPNSNCFNRYVDTPAAAKRDVADNLFTRRSTVPQHGFVMPSLAFDP